MEALAVVPLALVVMARGLTALVQGGMWESSKLSPPRYLFGQKGELGAIGYIGLGLFLLAAWGLTFRHLRAWAIVGMVLALTCVIGGFGGSIGSDCCETATMPQFPNAN